MHTSWSASPIFIAVVTALVLYAVIIFVLYASKNHGYVSACIAGILMVTPVVVASCVAVHKSENRLKPQTGGFETIADTVEPTPTLGAGTEDEDDRQLSELMKTILED